MSKRILLAWELGLNLGHLARLQPLAMRFKQQGHLLIAAVRDVQAAVRVFGALDIPLFQAPHAVNETRVDRVSSSYSNILYSQGWGNLGGLWGLVQCWVNLFRLTKPDLIVADHAPTAVLAAQALGIAVVQIGNGFELPPLTNPLPCLPESAGISAERLIQTEVQIVESINRVHSRLGVGKIRHLAELFAQTPRFLTCFAELDHYGQRTAETYWGPLLPDASGTNVAWPTGSGPRVFAYIALSGHEVAAIIRGLALRGARIVCVAPKLAVTERAQLQAEASIRFAERVNLAELAATADLCVSHGAEGTVSSFLLAGVPQLVRPPYLEGYAAARRIEQLNAGLVLRGQLTPEVVAITLDVMDSDSGYKTAALGFAEKYRHFKPRQTADAIANLLNQGFEQLLTQRSNR